MERFSDWELTAEVTVKPEVKLGKYKELAVKIDLDKKVSAADVNDRLKEEQNRMAELVLKEGTAKVGDTVVIDFVGSVDGVEFEGGKGNNHSLELGSGQFIPGFEDQLVGRKAGDEVSVTVTFPEDYQSKDLAGKAAVFATVVHEVKSKEIPELDDELAKDIDDSVESLEELKKKYKKEIEASKEQQYKDELESVAIDEAVKNAKIEAIPEEMIHEEVHRAMNEFLGSMQQQGITPEMYYQITGTSEDDLHTQYEEEADKRVRTNLVIEAIAKAEGFTVSKEDVEKEAADLAKQYNMPLAQTKQMLPETMLEHDIKMKKAVEAITDTAKVTGAAADKKTSAPKAAAEKKPVAKKAATTKKESAPKTTAAKKPAAKKAAAKKTTKKTEE
jgi:trigger factor